MQSAKPRPPPVRLLNLIADETVAIFFEDGGLCTCDDKDLPIEVELAGSLSLSLPCILV
jgi:hypothetical protein